MAVSMRTGKTRKRDMTRDHIQHVLDTVFNPLVVDTGRERILVDTGFGEKLDGQAIGG
jgi:hypothetical protein